MVITLSMILYTCSLNTVHFLCSVDSVLHSVLYMFHMHETLVELILQAEGHISHHLNMAYIYNGDHWLMPTTVHKLL